MFGWGANRVEHFGALHLHRGRLWVGKPRGVRCNFPGRWIGICLTPAGVRCYEGGIIARRRTAWDEITSITVRFDGRDLTGYDAQSTWGALNSGPDRVVSMKWLRGNAWNQNVLLVPSAWDGEVTEQKTHAVRHLPDALRRRPSLRLLLATEGGIADLLDRLAAAPDVEAIDRILGEI